MSTKTARLLWPAVLLILAGLTVALGTAGTARAGAPTPTSTSGPSPTAGAVTVMTKTGPQGTYLVDGQGRSLYLFVADTGTTSTCNGACAAAWPPLTVA